MKAKSHNKVTIFQHVKNCHFLLCERKLKAIVQLSKIFYFTLELQFSFVTGF